MYTWQSGRHNSAEVEKKVEQNIRHASDANMMFPGTDLDARARKHVNACLKHVHFRWPFLKRLKILSKKWLFGTKSQTKAVLARVLRTCHFKWTRRELSLTHINISRWDSIVVASQQIYYILFLVCMQINAKVRAHHELNQSRRKKLDT